MPTVPTYSAADYARAMANLLPRGPVWRRDPGSNMMALMDALAPTYQRSGAAAAQLVSDIFPATTTTLIPEWEETLGLPDPCTPLNPSTQQRAAAILAKFIGSGGQSAPYFISVAAALGFTITITEFTPFRLGWSRLGTALAGPGWESVWQINASTITASKFHLGTGHLGDPFWSVGNTELECRIRAIAPAHTKLVFVYSSGLAIGLQNDGGVLILVPNTGYPTTSSGGAGSLWSNGGIVSVVPGITPNPLAPPVLFSGSTAAGLLALGGGNLPITSPSFGSGQLWNNAGEVCIA